MAKVIDLQSVRRLRKPNIAAQVDNRLARMRRPDLRAHREMVAKIQAKDSVLAGAYDEACSPDAEPMACCGNCGAELF